MKSLLILSHFAAAVIVTGIIMLVYASVQQSHRSSANDPQLQVARDLKNAISKGRSINDLMAGDTIDLSQSLAVFREIFNRNGTPLYSTGLLNGQLPQPPSGIFEYTNAHIEDVLTWQPQNGVRMAMVFEKVNHANVGFVAVGRSLREVEIREADLVKMCGITWLACMAVLLIHMLVQNYRYKKVYPTPNS